ncbi:penicillin-insensitive murein endopeptidase [Rhizobium sp. TRM95796]|uniref:penicillin-insensitive murein endopeptidase n=1 Tax=Rhizobium sp. TRM95796 TaxID=2979862 RepID=UPI003994B3B8
MRKIMKAWLGAILIAASALGAVADETTPAKQLFGKVTLPSRGQAASIGFYAKGCLSGGVAIPVDGPAWQVLHLSRNRRWGNPRMIALLERLSYDGQEKAGWSGLLVGDISQPRGGPMLTGHASHQIGLDADIWLTPMPNRQLSYQERETFPENSVLRKGALTVDPNKWTPAHARIIMTAASYPEVERVFVHPGIKKKLCETWRGDRTLLSKVRPIYGHHYHFHIRMKCPPGAKGCTDQADPPDGDGCGKPLAWWFTDEPWGNNKPKTPPKKPAKPVKPRQLTLANLPKACAMVLGAPSVGAAAGAEYEPSTGGPAADPVPLAAYAAAPSAGDDFSAFALIGPAPIPRARPLDQ